MSSTIHLENHAREALGMPPEWTAHTLSCLPRPRDGQSDWNATHFLVIGCVAPLKQDGKTRNWRKRDKSTEREFIVSIPEQEAWERAWSERTGKCINCHGTGQEWNGWSVDTGTRYKPCAACGATGKVRQSFVAEKEPSTP